MQTTKRAFSWILGTNYLGKYWVDFNETLVWLQVSLLSLNFGMVSGYDVISGRTFWPISRKPLGRFWCNFVGWLGYRFYWCQYILELFSSCDVISGQHWWTRTWWVDFYLIKKMWRDLYLSILFIFNLLKGFCFIWC